MKQLQIQLANAVNQAIQWHEPKNVYLALKPMCDELESKVHEIEKIELEDREAQNAEQKDH